MARFSTTFPVVKTVSGHKRYLMTSSAFVSLDGSYTALRSDFKSVFLAGAAFPEKLITYCRKSTVFSGRSNATEAFVVRIIGGRLHIGCMVFSAATKRQIIKWALGQEEK